MPKIPKYSRRKFQSTYVGGPQTDKSGSIIAEGVDKATAPVLEQQIQKEEAKIQASIDQQANNAVIKYGIKYQEEARGLQEQYANDPTKFPTAVAEMGQELANEMNQGIPDERVSARFMGGTTSVIKQSSASALAWVGAKQDENALIAANDSVRLASIKTSQTTTVAGFQANLDATLEEIKAIPNFQQGDEEKFIAEKVPGLLETSMNSRLYTDIDGLEADLNSGAYNDVMGFSGKMGNDFKAKIETRRRRIKTQIKESQVNVFSDLVDLEIENALTFSDITAAENAVEEEDRISPKHASILTRNLVNKAEANAANLSKSNGKAKNYIDLVYKTIENRVDRAEILGEISSIYSDGTVTQEEAKVLSGIAKPLKDARRATILNDWSNRLKSVADTQSKLFPANAIIKTAEAFRGFLEEVSEGKDPGEVAAKMNKEAVIKKLNSIGIGADDIPPGGKRMRDTKNNKYIWVYPDGTYKVES